MPLDAVLRRTDAWWNLVADDLRVARILLTEQVPSPRNSAFHAQQACEKALKSLLVWRSLEVPYSHNLLVLLEKLEDEVWARGWMQVASRLTPYAVTTRYPGIESEVGVDEAVSILRDAEAFVRACLAKIVDEGYVSKTPIE